MADIQPSIASIPSKTFICKTDYASTLSSWTEATDKALLGNRSLSRYVDNAIKHPINNAKSSTSHDAELKSLSTFVVQCVKTGLLDDAHQTLRVLEDSLKDNPELHLEVFEKYILAFVKYQEWMATESGRLAYNLLLEKYEGLLTKYAKDASKKIDLLSKITAKMTLASSVQEADNQKARDKVALLTPYIARLIIMIKPHNPQVAKNLSVYLMVQSTQREYQPQYSVLPRAAHQLLPKKNLAQAGGSQ